MKSRFLGNLKFVIFKPRLILKLIKNYFLILIGDKPLRTVEIALTYKCPMGCKYCSAVSFHEKNKKELSVNNIKKIIDESINLGAIHFLFTGGEPLLSNKLIPLLNYVSKKGYISSIATSGYGLNIQKIKELKNSKISLVELSFDSINADIHNDFRKAKYSFENSMNSINLLKKVKVPTILNYVIRKDNLYELNDLMKLSKKLEIGVNLGFSSAVGKWKNNKNILLNDKEYESTKKYLKNKRVRWCGESSYLKKGCTAGLEKIYVSPYGDVSPCPLIPKIFGNIKDKNLKDITMKIRKNYFFNRIHRRCLPSYNKEFLLELDQ